MNLITAYWLLSYGFDMVEPEMVIGTGIKYGFGKDLIFLEREFAPQRFCVILSPNQRVEWPARGSIHSGIVYHATVWVQQDVGCTYVKIPSYAGSVTADRLTWLYKSIRGMDLPNASNPTAPTFKVRDSAAQGVRVTLTSPEALNTLRCDGYESPTRNLISIVTTMLITDDHSLIEDLMRQHFIILDIDTGRPSTANCLRRIGEWKNANTGSCLEADLTKYFTIKYRNDGEQPEPKEV